MDVLLYVWLIKVYAGKCLMWLRWWSMGVNWGE